MWNWISFAFFLLILSLVHARSASIPNGNGVDPTDDISQFVNTDVQLLNIENMDTAALLSFTESNLHFAALAANTFKRVHSKKTVKITNLYHETPINAFNGGDIRDTDDEIIIQHFGTALKVLKYFGNSILHLKLDFDPNNQFYRDNSSMRTLSKSINGNCSNTLLHFDLNGNGQILEEMTKPFNQVKHISMRHGSFKDFGSNFLSFGELFPALERLHLEYIVVKNINCLDQKFSNLQHLSIPVSYNTNGDQFGEYEIESFLRKNPQINSLNIGGSNKRLLRHINDILPNLEQLTIRGYDKKSDDGLLISFKSVKNLTISAGFDELPTNISFENLIELHASASNYGNGNKWLELAEQSQHLKKLFVSGEVSQVQLGKLKQIGLNLDEISLEFQRGFSDESVINFVKKSDKIKKIHIARFSKPYSLKPVAKALRDELGYKRKITETVFQLWIE